MAGRGSVTFTDTVLMLAHPESRTTMSRQRTFFIGIMFNPVVCACKLKNNHDEFAPASFAELRQAPVKNKRI
jgi:hypothetical protein